MQWFFLVYIDVFIFMLYLYWDHKHRNGLAKEDLEARRFFAKFLIGILITIRVLKGVFFEDFYGRRFADIYDERNIAKHEIEHDLCLVSAAPFSGAGCFYLTGEDNRNDINVCYERIAPPVCVYEMKRKVERLKNIKEIEPFLLGHLREISSRYPDYVQGMRTYKLIDGVSDSPQALKWLFDRFINICVDQYDSVRCSMAINIFRILDKDGKIIPNKLKALLKIELRIRALKHSMKHNVKNMLGILGTPKRISNELSKRDSEIKKLQKKKEDMGHIEHEMRRALDSISEGLSKDFDLNYSVKAPAGTR